MNFNNTKYFISPLLGSNNEVEINKRDYDGLVFAKNEILAALQFEEALHITILNHFDYETYIFEDSLQKSVQQIDEQQLGSIRIHANQRISNTLASIYNYMQYSNRNIKLIKNKGDIFNQKRTDFLKKCTVFSFMSELRHYTQHYGFAASAFEISNGIKEVDGDEYHVTKLKPTVILSSLKSDNDFYEYYSQEGNEDPVMDKIRKDSINNLLKAKGTDKQDITSLLRFYIDKLWEMHLEIRAEIEPKITKRKKHILEMGKKALSKGNLTYFDGFKVFKKNEAESSSSTIPIRIVFEHNALIKKYKYMHLSKMVP
ncbi:hypothetical protein [Legionella worsleiensis]|uniref:Uncharacterized protein n=1 Tax=Legionella worsleiensis TaxID=45076 RepID=A0A0W1A385_9GAMM|nr:hypothetical protein [Legionella worsleiensis]KTD75766.1 hypothetical protein Lwor_2332 [Legionella worsleiensis]STY32783.1 Uncharacterised protein [Legionella worsleiensis]